MSTPDTPDWVPGQSDIATEEVLYTSGTPGHAMPIDTQPIDVRAWNSVVVATSLFGVRGSDFASVQLSWIDGAGNVSTTTYIITATTGSGYGAFGETVRVPAYADFVEVTVEAGASVNICFLAVFGSTRQLNAISIQPNSGAFGTAAVFQVTKSLGAGAQDTFWFGPLTKGFYLSVLAVLATTTARLSVVAYDGANFPAVRAGQMLTIANQAVQAEFDIAMMPVSLIITNTAGAASTYSALVTPVQ